MDVAWPVEIAGIEPISHLGAGGFGQVWLANQTNLKRKVAVKVSHIPFTTEDDKRRFDRECQALGQLGGHPHIIEVYTSGISNNLPYIVLQFVDGGTLDDHGRALSEPQLRSVTDQLCQAVSAAHDRGVLHRDLKPENVFLQEDKTVILGDFGIARLGDGNNTSAAGVTGSMAFVAPEVLQGQNPSVQADIYGIGITIISAVLGNSPFVDPGTTNIHAIINNVINAQPPNLSTAGLSSAFQGFLLRAISADPTQRPQTVAALRDELQQLSAPQQQSPTQPFTSQQTQVAPKQPVQQLSPQQGLPPQQVSSAVHSVPAAGGPFAATEFQRRAEVARPNPAAATKGKGPLFAIAAIGVGGLIAIVALVNLLDRGDSTSPETATELTTSETSIQAETANPVTTNQSETANPVSSTEITTETEPESAESATTTEPTPTETTRRTTELVLPLNQDDMNSVIGATGDPKDYTEFDTADSEVDRTVCGLEFTVVGKTDGTFSLLLGETGSVSQNVDRFSSVEQAEAYFDRDNETVCGSRRETVSGVGEFETTTTRVESEVIYGDETLTTDFASRFLEDQTLEYARQVTVRSGADIYSLSYATSDESQMAAKTDALLAMAMDNLDY